MSEAPIIIISAVSPDFALRKNFPYTKQGIADLRKIIEFIETQIPREKNEK